MSKIEKQIVAATKQAIPVIGNIAQAGLVLAAAVPQVSTPLRVIVAITTALQEAMTREISPEDLAEKINEAVEEMNATIAQNDADLEAAADAKFGKRTEPAPHADASPEPAPKP